MDAIKELTQINYGTLIIAICTILLAFKFMWTLFDWFIKLLGLETRSMRLKREEHELLIATSKALNELKEKECEDTKQAIKHDQMIKNDLAKLSETVDNIAVTLNEMKEKDNITEVKKLKEKLVAYYNKYKNSEGWTKVEKDVFWDLFDDYEKRGGDGFIHSIVEPVMREMKEID